MPDKPKVPEVVELAPTDAPLVVSVLCEAFRDYPVMRYVLGEAADYDARLSTLITFFVMARVFRGEPLLGVPGPRGDLQAAAVVSFPGRTTAPPAFDALRGRTWAELGEGERLRYERFGAATAPFGVTETHVHLNMIGTRAAARGRGLGRIVLDHVQDLSTADPASVGVSLSTEREENVALYRHVGYQVRGSARVEDAFTTWVMFRPDAP